MHHAPMSWEITLLYFFSGNFIWALQKDPIKVQNFRKISTAQVNFIKFVTLIGSFCWKYMQFQLKKIQRSYVSWYWRLMQNLKKNKFDVSKLTRIRWILIQALKSLQNFHFDWSLSCKVYNLWPKKLQRSYLSWHQRVCKI